MLVEKFSSVVMQPVTVCNADCGYCYLPTRRLNMKMDKTVARKVAEAVQNQATPVLLIWHGGEPLASGIKHFRALLEPFEGLRKTGLLRHSIQTNATLIDEGWCKLFLEYEFSVGISMDGPEWANIKRVDLAGKPIFSKIMRGVGLLKSFGVRFGVISVVHEANIQRVEEFYEFFCQLGCDQLSINIEEVEGVNTATSEPSDDQVSQFWSRLFRAQQRNPVLKIREFDSTLRYVDSVLSNNDMGTTTLFEDDLFPTVSWKGDVYLLSPEFGGYEQFIVGNLRKDGLIDILTAGRNVAYVVEFEKGVMQCQKQCPYFAACRGGYASNKYFEHGTTNATQTNFCRNSRMKLVDAVIENA
jgi:uncharacterized protein